MFSNSLRMLAVSGALAMGVTLSAGAVPTSTPGSNAGIEACGGKGGCGCGQKKDSDKSCDKCGTSECACGKDDSTKKTDTPDPAAKVIDLENDKCPIMGGKAKKDVYVDYEGVRVHFCCPGCDKTFLEDPAKYLEKLGIKDLAEYKRQHAKK